MRISLVIPVKDEEHSLSSLIESICGQTMSPAEIIFVDGGSSDATVAMLKEFAGRDSRVRVIEAGEATPGKGRNIGTEAAESEWIAFTDAGIVLDPDWLERLVDSAAKHPDASAVYGTYTPVTERRFEKIACVSYCAAQGPNGIRGRSIASALVKRSAWQKVGGFPDLRAGEDLMFMEALDAGGFTSVTEPRANIRWFLRPDSSSTFEKFSLYAMRSSMVGRTHDWHHGILRQYIAILPFLILGVLHSRLWFAAVPVWLVARAIRRAIPHRHEFGFAFILNPLNLLGLIWLILVIDAATYIGWLRGILARRNQPAQRD